MVCAGIGGKLRWSSTVLLPMFSHGNAFAWKNTLTLNKKIGFENLSVATCIRLDRNRLCRLRRLEHLTAAIVSKTETLAWKYFKSNSTNFNGGAQLMLSCDYTESRTGKGEMLAPEMIWSWWTDSNFRAAVCFIFRVSYLRNACILLISPLQARW